MFVGHLSSHMATLCLSIRSIKRVSASACHFVGAFLQAQRLLFIYLFISFLLTHLLCFLDINCSRHVEVCIQIIVLYSIKFDLKIWKRL